MTDAEELRTKAERKLRLAAAVTDDAAAANLCKLAADFLARARALEQRVPPKDELGSGRRRSTENRHRLFYWRLGG
jgi:hypothetical protein